jgi:hypothetical protein
MSFYERVNSEKDINVDDFITTKPKLFEAKSDKIESRTRKFNNNI